MSTYSEAFQAYQQAQLYPALTGLALLAGLLVIGWYVAKLLFRKSPIRRFIEWGYLAYCGVTYLVLIVVFVR